MNIGKIKIGERITMTEPDELYTLRAQFWLGHYGLCVTEGKSLGRRPMTPQLKAEREEFITRAMLAMGDYDKVIRQGDVPDVSPSTYLHTYRHTYTHTYTYRNFFTLLIHSPNRKNNS